MDDRNATQPPAIGPPSTMAATMNGRWKVRTPCPDGPRRTLAEPARPNSVQRRTPAGRAHASATIGTAIGPASVPKAVTSPSTAIPATIVAAV